MYDLFHLADDPNDVGIHLFNMPEDGELDEMFERPAPDEFAAVVALFFRNDDGRANASALLNELLAEGQLTSMPKFELAPKVKTFYVPLALPAVLGDVMSSAQQAWWHHDVYVQCGFWCPNRADDESLLRGISLAMTWFDTRVTPSSRHNVLNPVVMAFEAQYPDDPTPGVIARNYGLVIGNLFRERVGIWCKDLVEPRNEILVKVRARLAGQDPATQWARFKTSGMAYFLDCANIPAAH